jgi:hypothetical protein
MLRSKTFATTLLVLFCSCFALRLGAVTVHDLRSDPQLTPQRFGRYFANFEFEFRAQVQPPEIFLRTKSGDCDDYATLAADVLKQKGYTPHLITVRMPKIVHVVCYIEETKSYLDFNKRNEAACTVSTDGSLADIAQQVARSYKTAWTSVSEFTFDDGTKRLVTTLVKNAPAHKEPRMAEAQVSFARSR